MTIYSADLRAQLCLVLPYKKVPASRGISVMKTWVKSLGCMFFICCLADVGYSYVFYLSNITSDAYQIRVKLAGIGEPYYVLGPDPFETKENYNNVVEPNAAYELHFRACHGPSDYSRKFGYCLAPSTFEYRKIASEMSMEEAWNPLNLHYIDVDHAQKIVDAAAALANGLRDVAGAILSTIPVFGPDALRAIKAIDLGAVVRNIAVLAEYSMCRGRSFYLALERRKSLAN